MRSPETVQLIVGGVLVTVPRRTGFELLDRDRRLLADGLTEQTQLVLEEQRRVMLHLLLGAGHLALIESAEPPWASGAEPDEDEHEDEEVSPDADLFIDFDAYRSPARDAD